MTTIFVFGSNLAGRHGKGSALEARRNHGAIYGQGTGRQGNSYAIATRDGRDGGPITGRLSLLEIQSQVLYFLAYARFNPEDTFNVVKIGCSNAGYTEKEIAPMFAGAPANVNLPEGWRELCS